MRKPFTVEEVWDACKKIHIFNKLAGRADIFPDTLNLARHLSSDFPEGANQFWLKLQEAERVLPGLQKLHDSCIVSVMPQRDVWEAYKEWSLHPSIFPHIKDNSLTSIDARVKELML